MWNFPPDQLTNVSGFRFYIGTNEGTYLTFEDTGSTNLWYWFRRTNWSESTIRHWYAITALPADGVSRESSPSDPAHWPLFPPDHIKLFWSSNWPSTGIQRTVDFQKWVTIATVSNTNSFSEPMQSGGLGFYRIDKPETVTLTVFNPDP